MQILNFVLISICFIVCFICAITDIKYGKIKNIVIFPSILIAFSLNLILSIYQGLTFIFLINVLMMNIVSFILYVFHFWGAGDSKFLFFIVASVPPTFYYNRLMGIFPSISILISIFLVALFYVAIESIIILFFKKEKNPYKLKWKWKLFIFSYLQGLIGITAINQILFFCLPNFYEKNWYCIMLLNFFVVMKLSELQWKGKEIWIFVIGTIEVIVTVLTSYKERFTSIDGKMPIIFLLILIFKLYIDRFNYKTVSVEKLREGMVLDTPSSTLFQKSFIEGLPSISTEDLRSKLSIEEISAIRQWSKTGNGKFELVIVKKLPFGLFLAIGTILFIAEGIIRK